MTISRVGAATGTTTFTIPTPAIGDLIVVWAFRSATGGVTLPAGWRNIANGNGTSSSFRLAYKIATSTSTASGTWTSATATLCVVYRSSNYASGSTLFVGGNANTHLTTTTITYPAVTMTHTDSTSWVAGFAGISVTTDSLSTHAPSGMTFYTGSDLSNTVEICAYDTNGTVNSWSSTNVTVTNAGNSCSATLEIIENQAGSAISNIIQHVAFAGNNAANASTDSGNNFVYNLPNPTLANNILVLAVSYPSGSTPAITDDKSNTWPTSGGTGTFTEDAGAGGMALQIFRLNTVATGTQQINVGFGSAVVNPCHVWITELYNITGTINGTAGAINVAATTAIISPGSMTPTNNNANGGNLILCYVGNASTTGNGNPTNIYPETGYTLNDADISWTQGQGWPKASQFFLQATSAATTARFYMPGVTAADTYNIAAVALSVGTQGTAKPAGIHIDRICHFGNSSNPAAWLLQIPNTGNLGYVVGFMSSVATPVITSVTDGDGTSWTQINSTGGEPNPYYRPNYGGTNPSTRTLTVNFTGTAQTVQLIYYDISGAATSPLDTFAAVGTTSTNNVSSIASQPSITPGGQNELILGYLQNSFGPTTGVSIPSGATWDLPNFSQSQFTATIATTTMTVSATAWGTINNNGVVVSGSGVTAGTTIQAGTGPTYTIQPSQTVLSATTMNTSQDDSNTMGFGNGGWHWYNGSNTSAQSITWNIGNQPSNSVTSIAVAFKAAPTGGSAFPTVPIGLMMTGA